MGLGLLAVGLLFRPGRRAWGGAILAAGVLALVSAWVMAPPSVTQSLEGLLETRPTEEVRWGLWKDTGSLASAHVLTGAGMDSFQSVFSLLALATAYQKYDTDDISDLAFLTMTICRVLKVL